MSRYRQTMREALEQVRQQFTEGHSDKDFKPYPDWKKTAGGMYPRFKHTQKGEIQVDRYGEWLHSDKSGKTVAFYRNHFPKTNTTGGTSMKLTDYLKKINEEVINEVSDHEVSMARGELEAIAVKATHLAGALQGKSDEGNPLEAWVQSKITKAKDYINSVSDYLMYNPDMKQNEETLEEKFALYALRDFTDTRAPGGMRKKGDRASGPMTYTQAISKAKQMNAGSSVGGSKDVEVRPVKEELEEAKIISDISGVSINKLKQEVMPFNVKVGRVGPGMDSDYEVEFTGSEPNLIKYAKKHLDFDGNSFSQLKKHLAMEETEVNEKTYGWTLVSKAKDLAKKFKDNITKAVAEIEKLEKGLSKNPTVDAELRKYNENLEEKYTVVITKKDGTTMELGKYNTSAEAQRYVDQYGTGAKIKKEEVEFDEIDEKISDIFKANKEGESIDNIAKRLKLSTSMVKKLIGEAIDDEDKEKDVSKETDTDKIKLAKEKDTDTLEKQLIAAQGQINILKQKLENEKNKTIKPEPNPETGEVPLTIGIAHAEFKKEKEKKEVKEDISEKAMTDREKRLQRAKDMIKYYDAQKKAALKGKNKDLAKKMLKNDTEIKEVSDKLKLKVLKKKIKQYKDKVFKKTMSTVKSPLFADKEIEEALEIKEFTSQMIDRLKKSFSTAPKKISPEQANKLSKHLDRIDLNDLRKLVKANIPFVSTVARNKIYKKTGKFENTSAFNPSVHNNTLGVTTKDLDRAFKKLSNQAQSYVNELLRTGMGSRDAIKKAKQRFNENNIIEDRRLYVEAIAGLQKKADKSGMPYSILKQVYDRGMAAWKGGHRPGASQQQWAFARVNSFVTKSSGTWGGADKDLAKQVKGK